MPKVLYISGVPVRAFQVGGQCVAIIGAEGTHQIARSADTLLDVMEKVVLALEHVRHFRKQSAA